MNCIRNLRVGVPVAIGAVLLLACGGEETPQRRGPDMAPTTTGTAGSGENQPPAIEWVRLDPSDPVPGDRVVAKIKASDPEGDSIEFGFVWTVGGRRVPGGGPAITLPAVPRGPGND